MQRHPGATLRGWREVCPTYRYVQLAEYSILALDHSNEGVIASIIPRLCPTLSPDTVSSPCRVLPLR